MNKFTMGLLTALTGIMTLGTSMNAFGFLGFGNSATWKEEVLLHDGKTIVAERKQTYGGKPTIDSRERSVLDEEWTFQNPDNQQQVVWKNNLRRPPEGSSLMLMILGIKDGAPYIATSPAGCIAYNHWGRPNPPYVFFRYDGAQWQRIPLAEFPVEFKDANVVVGGRGSPEKQSGKTLSVAMVHEQNKLLESHLRAILREAYAGAGGSCGEMVYDGHGGWTGIGWFKKQSSREACLKYCEREKIAAQYCPCEKLFEGK